MEIEIWKVKKWEFETWTVILEIRARKTIPAVNHQIPINSNQKVIHKVNSKKDILLNIKFVQFIKKYLKFVKVNLKS